MNIDWQHNRQIGRTTRTLERAYELVKEGKNVVVLCASTTQTVWIRNKYLELTGDEEHAHLNAKQWIRFYSLLDYRRGALAGLEAVMLVDHYALETAFINER